MKDTLDPVHKRYVSMVSSGTALYATLIGDEENAAFLSDLVGEAGAQDRRSPLKQHPVGALSTAIYEAVRAFDRLDNIERFSSAILSVDQVDFLDRSDAVRQLNWSQLYTCRERHRRIGQALPLAGSFQPTIADWISKQCSNFKEATDKLLVARGRATHIEDHHDAYERQWNLMRLHSVAIRMRTGREMDDPGLGDLDRTIDGFQISLIDDLTAECEAQRSDMRLLSSEFLEKLEPLVRRLYDELSKHYLDNLSQ